VDDLSADGEIAKRIRAELAAHAPLRDESFTVRATTDGRGNGLFVAPGHSITSGTYLFDYEGRWIESDEYEQRYPQEGKAHADYAVGIARADGSTVFVDAADRAESNLARYMNHADGASANCHAWTLAEPTPRVLLFAGADLEAGEELVWDYGESYWEGREDKL